MAVPGVTYLVQAAVHMSGRGCARQATAMAEAALRNADLAEAEVECAPKVLELVLQACRGRVDPCVGHYIALALDRRVTLQVSQLNLSLLSCCPAHLMLGLPTVLGTALRATYLTSGAEGLTAMPHTKEGSLQRLLAEERLVCTMRLLLRNCQNLYALPASESGMRNVALAGAGCRARSGTC